MTRLKQLGVSSLIVCILVALSSQVSNAVDVLDLLRSTALGSLTTYDEKFAYIDTYLNPCLNKLAACANGFILVVNVTLVSQNVVDKNEYGYGYSFGRLSILTSGGDSPYSHGGFYLHQVSSRGDNYIEFGLSLYENLYTTNVSSKLLNLITVYFI